MSGIYCRCWSQVDKHQGEIRCNWQHNGRFYSDITVRTLSTEISAELVKNLAMLWESIITTNPDIREQFQMEDML